MKRITYSIFILLFLFSINGVEKATAEILSPPPLPCSATTNIVVGSITSSSATISWDAVPGALQYNIRRRVVGDIQWKVVGVSAPNTQIIFTNLSSGSEYEFQIRTFCDAGYKAHSPFASGPNFTTLSTCPAPDKLLTSDITSTSAKANWITTLGSTQYRLRIRKVGTIPWTLYAVAGGGTSSFLFTGLVHSTDYEWQIRSRCTGPQDLSAFSASDFFTTPCGQPQNISIDSILSSSAIASWDTVDGAYQYRLRRRVVGNVDWVNSYTLAPDHHHRFVSMLAGTEYEFQIQTFCDAGFTDSSGYVSGPNFTTNSDCLIPDGLSTTNVVDVSATANWNVVSNSTQYRVRIREVGSGTWSVKFIAGGLSNSYEFTGLNPSTDYEWSIRTICRSLSDFSAWSSVEEFTTAAARLSMPVGKNNDEFEPINLYPNPNRGKMLIEMNTGCKCMDDAVVQISNMLGQNVYAGNIVTENGYINSEITLNENLVNGMYFIRISQGNNSYNSHFLLSK